MTNSHWPDPQFSSISDYRSNAQRSHQQQLFGTDRPVAFITGSCADRVGRAIAKRFAAHGYRIVLHGNRSVSEANALIEEYTSIGIETMIVQGSIDQEENVSRWLQEIDEKFQRLDVVVHSAAVWDPRSLEETDAGLIRQQWEVNTLGSFLIAKHSGLRMTKQETGGSIVLVGDWAIERPYRDFSAYFTSKGTIPTLTRSMAVELGERNCNVRVNAVLPGPVMLVEGVSEQTKEAILNQCLLHRQGTAEHVAQAAIFLAEHSFLTGVCLPVDGGRTIYSGSIADAIAHPKKLG
jgi:pteridine reductase